MIEIVQIVIGGLQVGCIYALVALGFSLVYRVTNVINLSQGAFCMVGALLAYSLATQMGWNLAAAIVVAAVATTLIGIVAGALAFVPGLGRLSNANMLMLTAGLLTLFEGLMLVIWGSQPYASAPFSGETPVSIAGILIPTQQFWIAGATVVIIAILWYLLQKTTLGQALRACAENPMAASLMGISVSRMQLFSFALAALIGALAGADGGVARSVPTRAPASGRCGSTVTAPRIPALGEISLNFHRAGSSGLSFSLTNPGPSSPVSKSCSGKVAPRPVPFMKASFRVQNRKNVSSCSSCPARASASRSVADRAQAISSGPIGLISSTSTPTRASNDTASAATSAEWLRLNDSLPPPITVGRSFASRPNTRASGARPSASASSSRSPARAAVQRSRSTARAKRSARAASSTERRALSRAASPAGRSSRHNAMSTRAGAAIPVTAQYSTVCEPAQ